MKWSEAQKWEKWWWGDCVNTLFEEEKQIVYAKKMGLKPVGNEKTPYEFDLEGKSVLDIGGGAVSLLLKCRNMKGVVADPLDHPQWVIDRYKAHGIDFKNAKGEDLNIGEKFDEVWIYNVLQHVEDPQKVIKNAKRLGKIIRIFEWLYTPVSDGHPCSLKRGELDRWLGGIGKVEVLKTRPTIGTSYYGIFPT